MNDHGRSRAFLRGDFVLVSPAAVISHRFSFEHLLIEPGRIFRIWNKWIVNQYQDRFAPDIDVFVIVPAIFRRDDSVTDEHDVGIVDLDLRLQSRRRRDEVIRIFQFR